MHQRPVLDLFLISWLVLFLELACIRWFPAHVLFLTFFTNTVLLACFVGMSIGCLVARRPGRLIRGTPIWLLAAISAGLLIDGYSGVLWKYIAVGDQVHPDEVFFGTERGAVEKPGFVVPIEFVGALFFVLIAVMMVGPGQELGRAFNRVANRTAAYSANLVGSLVGIGVFAASSYFQLPPVVWFAASALVIALLVLRADPDSPARRPALVGLLCLAAATGLSIATSGFWPLYGRDTTWSPYYRIDYWPTSRFINTNLISQQFMEGLDEPSVAPYALPYLFQRDVKTPAGTAAWPPFERILIIGAGSGNDVARALHWVGPNAQIDAVEIDPVIQKLGERHHPNQPFQDPRVHVHLNDGRNFLRHAPAGTYDLVIFALIDSLVLQSGYSNLRLESYLFTLESFRDAERVLKPTGVCAVYNFFRHGWIAARVREQLREAFHGSDPIGLMTLPTAPPLGHVALDTFEPHGFTLFFAGSPRVLDPVRAAFAGPTRLWHFELALPMRYWYPRHTGVGPDTAARFSAFPPTTDPGWYGLRIATIAKTHSAHLATDDWPFLYTRHPTIPGLTVRGAALMLVLSGLLWFAFGGNKALAGGGSTAPEWGTMARSFFLGAGFMLVETRAVVQLALLFGGTWMVNTIVFAAILAMSLLGNLFAGRVNPRRLEPYYVGLFAVLGAGLLVPPGAFLGLDPALQILGVCALVFAPIAFAGVIFATTFRRTSQPDRVFGANIAGALVGGLSENASVLLGFQLLLCVAAGYYLLSAAFGNREGQ